MVWHTSPGHRVEEMPLRVLWVALRVPMAPTVEAAFEADHRRYSPWAQALIATSRTRGRVMTTQKAYRKAGILTAGGVVSPIGVAPSEWPRGIEWPLRAPPTPYEVASLITAPRGFPMRPKWVSREEWRCAKGELLRWFTSHPQNPQAHPPDHHLEALRALIVALMADPRTLTWALGADMRALPARWQRMVPRKRLKHPYLKGLRLRGGSDAPLRPLPAPQTRLLWPAQADKSRDVAAHSSLYWPNFRYRKTTGL